MIQSIILIGVTLLVSVAAGILFFLPVGWFLLADLRVFMVIGGLAGLVAAPFLVGSIGKFSKSIHKPTPAGVFAGCILFLWLLFAVSWWNTGNDLAFGIFSAILFVFLLPIWAGGGKANEESVSDDQLNAMAPKIQVVTPAEIQKLKKETKDLIRTGMLLLIAIAFFPFYFTLSSVARDWFKEDIFASFWIVFGSFSAFICLYLFAIFSVGRKKDDESISDNRLRTRAPQMEVAPPSEIRELSKYQKRKRKWMLIVLALQVFFITSLVAWDWLIALCLHVQGESIQARVESLGVNETWRSRAHVSYEFRPDPSGPVYRNDQEIDPEMLKKMDLGDQIPVRFLPWFPGVSRVAGDYYYCIYLVRLSVVIVLFSFLFFLPFIISRSQRANRVESGNAKRRTMKAIVFDRFGQPDEVLEVREAPMPEPGRGEVRVRMLASPVNPSDLLVVRGQYGRLPKLPATPGFEGVGLVDRAGPGLLRRIRGLKPGRRVAVLNASGGNWQEYVVVPARQLVPLPVDVPDEQAAAFFVNPASVLVMVRHVLKVPRGAWLLQTAAGSALGRMVIRLGRHDGFKTINVVRRREQARELLDLGGDAVICTSDESMEQKVAEITGKAGVALALDPVGGATGAAVAASLAHGGRLLVYGTLANEPIAIDPRVLIAGNKRIEGFWLSNWVRDQNALTMLGLFRRIVKLIRAEILISEFGPSFPLDAIQDAVKQAETPGRLGKVLLRISR